MLIGPGQLVEQGGFTAVLVSRQGENDMLFRRLPISVSASALFTDSRVGNVLAGLNGFQYFPSAAGVLVHVGDINLRRIRQPQGQRVAGYHQFHRIAHGCVLNQGDFNSGNQSHIQKMLPKGPLASHSRYYCRLSDF